MLLDKNYILFFFFILTLNFSIVYTHEKWSKIYNIYDYPDKIRKNHQRPTPLTGGLIILINLFFVTIYQNIFNEKIFISNYDFNIVFIVGTIFFLLGLYDDKKSISPLLKLALKTLIILTLLTYEPSILITKLKFSFISDTIGLSYNSSLLFTTLCFLLFINAFNMFDGIDLQSGFYAFILTSYFLILGFHNSYFTIILISILTFMYINFNKNAFIGDGGIFLLSLIFGYFFIKFYNAQIIKTTDEIFLLMLLPGMDMLRLFLIRIYNKKNPFQADRNHIHHLLLHKYNYFVAILFIASFLLLCLIFAIFLENYLIVIVLLLLFYFSFLKFLRN